MFCYSEICNGKHDNCKNVKAITNMNLQFKDFKDENEIEMAKEILCLVTSWEEPPYFVVMRRFEHGIGMDFNGEIIENTRILKWAYLPEFSE